MRSKAAVLAAMAMVWAMACGNAVPPPVVAVDVGVEDATVAASLDAADVSDGALQGDGLGDILDGALPLADAEVADAGCPPHRVPLVKDGVVVDPCGCCEVAPDCTGYFGGSPEPSGICPLVFDAAPPCYTYLDTKGCQVLGCSGSCLTPPDAAAVGDADADTAPDTADTAETQQGCGPGLGPKLKNGVVVDPCGCCVITGGCEGYYGGSPVGGKCPITYDAAPPCTQSVDVAGCPTLSCSGFCNGKPP